MAWEFIVAGVAVAAAVYLVLTTVTKKVDDEKKRLDREIEVANHLNFLLEEVKRLDASLSALRSSIVQNKSEFEKKIGETNEWHNARHNDQKKAIEKIGHAAHEFDDMKIRMKGYDERLKETNDLIHQLHVQSIKSVGDIRDSVDGMKKTCSAIQDEQGKLRQRQNIIYNKLKRRVVKLGDGVKDQVEEAKENAKDLL